MDTRFLERFSRRLRFVGIGFHADDRQIALLSQLERQATVLTAKHQAVPRLLFAAIENLLRGGFVDLRPFVIGKGSRVWLRPCCRSCVFWLFAVE